MSQPSAAIAPAATAPRAGWLPTMPLIRAKLLELRKRRALVIVAVLFTIGLPVLFLGIREGFHLADPKHYGPAADPGIFATLTDLMAEFGFIIAVTFGATIGTSDLTDGVFRQLVVTGRSRLALYLARIPAGLAVIASLAAVGFTVVCLFTAFLGVSTGKAVNVNGTPVPVSLTQAGLRGWALSHPHQAKSAFIGPASISPAAERAQIGEQLPQFYQEYASSAAASVNPSAKGMTDAGLWLELDLAVAFTVGLGLGSLMGQRTVPIILLAVLELILTPPLSTHVLPYFINGQRMIIGVAMNQLQPSSLTGGFTFHLLGPGGGQLAPIPPMPTWAMISVIAGWILGWSAIGAWRMATRDA